MTASHNVSIKNQLQKEILTGAAKGICGVATDPQQSKLIIFFTHKPSAKEFVAQFLPTFKHPVEYVSGLPVRRRTSLLSRLFRYLKKSNLNMLPGTPVIQRNASAKEGRVGCFVETSDSKVAALTVSHLFVNPDDTVEFYYGGDDAGTFLKKDSATDSALFLLDKNVTRLKHNQLIEDIVDKNYVASTKYMKVINLGTGNEGTVWDPNPTFLCPETSSTASANPILIKANAAFGQYGDSGSLVVMSEAHSSGKFSKYAALGLYSYICQNTYHFISPLHACFGKLGVSKITNP